MNKLSYDLFNVYLSNANPLHKQRVDNVVEGPSRQFGMKGIGEIPQTPPERQSGCPHELFGRLHGSRRTELAAIRITTQNQNEMSNQDRCLAGRVVLCESIESILHPLVDWIDS